MPNSIFIVVRPWPGSSINYIKSRTSVKSLLAIQFLASLGAAYLTLVTSAHVSLLLGLVALHLFGSPLLPSFCVDKLTIHRQLAQGSLTIFRQRAVLISEPLCLSHIKLSTCKSAPMSETKESTTNTNSVPSLSAPDDALDFLNRQYDTEGSPRGLADIRHKVDRRILPFMFCCYFLQFIDKVMYNVSFFFVRDYGAEDKMKSHH